MTDAELKKFCGLTVPELTADLFLRCPCVFPHQIATCELCQRTLRALLLYARIMWPPR
jgi:hypothetical protein